MPHIFVSYRRDDAGYVAGMLAERLRQVFGPDSVFIDVHSIPLGIDFRDHINNAVARCQVLLAVIGDAWLTAGNEAYTRRIDDPEDFVRIEIEAALARKIPVIPVLIRNAGMPSPGDLPGTLRSLPFLNAAELRAGRDMNHHLDLLIRNLQDYLRRDPPSPESTPEPATPEKKPTAAQASARLRFSRNTWAGRLTRFRLYLDGELVGELGHGETLEIAVSPGEHYLEVKGGGTPFGNGSHFSISAAQTVSWEVGYTLLGGIRLSRR